MSTTKVFIVAHDLLRDIGLKHLLTQYFNIVVEIITTEKIEEKLIDNNSIFFFTSADCYIASMEHFTNRQARAVIFSDKTSDRPNNLPLSINEEELINRLHDLLTKEEDTSSTTSGELSAREIEVLRLVALGYLNKEIANELSISINTVLTHRKNISSKLGIRSISGLSVYAMMNGYISASSRKR